MPWTDAAASDCSWDCEVALRAVQQFSSMEGLSEISFIDWRVICTFVCGTGGGADRIELSFSQWPRG